LDDTTILLRLSLLGTLLLISAFFSACEVALFSLNPVQLAELKNKKGRLGKLVNRLLEKPRELLITIYIGNEFANVAISVLTTSTALKIFDHYGVAIAIGAATFLLLVFGDIIPKSLAIKYAKNYSLFAVYPLKMFENMVLPLQKVLNKFTDTLIRLMGFDSLQLKKSALTGDEFRTMVHMVEAEGQIEADESEMIHNIIEFSETSVDKIMTPKIDMFTLNANERLEDILPQIMQNFYSRVPVYDQDGETIAGILFTKDLIRLKHLPKEKFNLKSILHSTLEVPETKKIKELLEEFRKQKRHMAIALDEYGSVSGLVTLEDILEELVGEIDSEMRKDEQPLTKIDENHFRLLGSHSLIEFNEYFNSDLPSDDYDTVGGLVFGLFGRVPRSGELVATGRFNFRVEKMQGARILKLYLTVLNSEAREQNKANKKEKPAHV